MLVIALLFVTVGVLFRGGMTPSVGVTVLAKRAGLVLNPDARVKLRGVQVGSVASLENLPDGRAALHLAMDPDRISEIPANVEVHIASTTVFGAKFIQLVDPTEPSTRTMYAGQVLDAGHVTVEIDTVFQRLTAVLDEIDPAELNATLSAMANALNGRGHRMGQMLADLDGYLAALDPQLPALSDILATAPGVLTGYAAAAPDLITTADNAARISRTVVDQRGQLDAALISAIWVGRNRKRSADREPGRTDRRRTPAGDHHRSDQPVPRSAVLPGRGLGEVGLPAAAPGARRAGECRLHLGQGTFSLSR